MMMIVAEGPRWVRWLEQVIGKEEVLIEWWREREERGRLWWWELWPLRAWQGLERWAVIPGAEQPREARPRLRIGVMQ